MGRGRPAATPQGQATAQRGERRRRSVMIRLSLACCLLIVPALVGTMASWRASGSAQVGAIEMGTLDLQVDGDLAGTGGTATRTWSATNLVPGQYQAFGAEVRNTGDAAFTYGLTVAAGSTWGYGDGVVEVSAFLGAAQADGTCTGSSIGSPRTVPANAPIFAARPLPTAAGGTAEPLCVRVGLVPTAPSSAQGSSGTLTLTFTATQVAP
ncbi:hypothetical protein GCM10023169_09040 [Georgenia halophila]|uniref:Ribosomally synthesized peptide with SipW-like signal peptide n=2 Tax=Georgenia halophila TaxID=620889 RepID=A0ABP8KY93_9MICO